MSQVVILGHRGAPRRRPENTVESIEAAIAGGADGVEIDARLTADGHVVVWHDPAIGDGKGGELLIKETPLSVLRRVDVSAVAKSSGYRSPTRLATLDEAIEAAAGHILDIELKNLPVEPLPDNEHLLPAKVAASIDGLDESVIVSCFWTNALDAFKAVAPAFRTGWLLPPSVTPADVAPLATTKGYNALLPEGNALGPGGWGGLDEMHHEGLAVWAWTIDDEAKARELIGYGVDGLISNEPEKIVSLIRKQP